MANYQQDNLDNYCCHIHLRRKREMDVPRSNRKARRFTESRTVRLGQFPWVAHHHFLLSGLTVHPWLRFASRRQHFGQPYRGWIGDVFPILGKQKVGVSEVKDDSTEGSFRYTGVESLEVMEAARNYNKHLLTVIADELSSIEVARASLDAPVTILDFGAGAGRFIKELRKPNRSLLAVEPDHMLANEILKWEGITLLNLADIPENSVHFAYSLNVFEHIANDKAALAELVAKLQPGGKVLVFVPAWPHLFSRFDESIGHCRRYTKSSLLQMLKVSAIRVERVHFFDPLGYFAALFFKVFSNQTILPTFGVTIFDRFLYPLSRILSSMTKHWLGKNLVLIARKL
jgi:SAM-dependent methyltransferase